MAEIYGELNAHAVGIVLKEIVRRMIVTAQSHLLSFDVQAKMGKSGIMDDMVTSVDLAAQHIAAKTIRECFPHIGLVAEESNLKIEPAPGYQDCYLTLDPVDGTKALVRRQSHGIGTMVALVWRGRIISAWIGDIMTQEIFGFRPESNHVHRIHHFEIAEHLAPHTDVPLEERYILLRDNPAKLSLAANRIVSRFKDIEVSGGSIGTMMARLWKGEVGGVILLPGREKPWDLCPVVGISQKLGFAFFRIDQRPLGLTRFQPNISPREVERNFEMLVIHEDYVRTLIRKLLGTS